MDRVGTPENVAAQLQHALSELRTQAQFSAREPIGAVHEVRQRPVGAHFVVALKARQEGPQGQETVPPA